jgi:hypothetical protein
VVNGVAAEWGPACRFMLDPVAAACPQTQLLNIPGNPYFSCGSHRFWATNQAAHANPVSGASQYQFRFRQPAEAFEYVRSTTSYFARLGWTNGPVLSGTYDVDVRAFKGGVWCQWGPVCQFTICPVNTTCPPVGEPEMLMTGDASIVTRMWPNPNRGDLLNISISEIPEGVLNVSVDIFDMFGRRVIARQIAAQDGFLSTVIALESQMSAGMYFVNITAGEKIHTERLVIQP